MYTDPSIHTCSSLHHLPATSDLTFITFAIGLCKHSLYYTFITPQRIPVRIQQRPLHNNTPQPSTTTPQPRQLPSSLRGSLVTTELIARHDISTTHIRIRRQNVTTVITLNTNPLRHPPPRHTDPRPNNLQRRRHLPSSNHSRNSRPNRHHNRRQRNLSRQLPPKL